MNWLIIMLKIHFQQADVQRAKNTYMRNSEKLQYLMNTVEKKNKIKISNNDNNISGQNKKTHFT